MIYVLCFMQLILMCRLYCFIVELWLSFASTSIWFFKATIPRSRSRISCSRYDISCRSQKVSFCTESIEPNIPFIFNFFLKLYRKGNAFASMTFTLNLEIIACIAIFENLQKCEFNLYDCKKSHIKIYVCDTRTIIIIRYFRILSILSLTSLPRTTGKPFEKRQLKMSNEHSPL